MLVLVLDEASFVFTANGQKLTVQCQTGNAQAYCQPEQALVPGVQTISATVQDYYQNQFVAVSRAFQVSGVIDEEAPKKPDIRLIQAERQPPSHYKITGLSQSVEANSQVVVTWVNQEARVIADNTGGFSILISAEPGQLSYLYSMDVAGNRSSGMPLWLVELPVEPVTVAPPPKADEPFIETIEFIYAGDNPIQIGVVPGSIEPHRAAVLRGRLLDWDDQPVPGVKVQVLGNGAYGYTRSRADGWYDLVVNGGGQLILSYEHPAYLSVQRRVEADWENYAVLETVRLTEASQKVTAIDLAEPVVQMAAGEVSEDENGRRESVLLFNPGTQAWRVRADGQEEAIRHLSVRITEFTVGKQGPQAMPASMPLHASYTYAAKISIGEAPGESVRFSQPVINYVDNYLGFRAGVTVPAGYYDERQGRWIGMESGRVIKVVAINNGEAAVDSTGDGLADDVVVNTVGERQALAQRYTVGQSLWRVELTHFSAVDYNYSWGCATELSGCEGFAVQLPEIKPIEPSMLCGSIVRGENQVLGEVVSLSELALHYASDRAAGRRTQEKFYLPISGKNLPKGLREITVILRLGGEEQKFVYREAEGEIEPEMVQVISQQSWKRDAYQRLLHGREIMRVFIGYGYDGVVAIQPRDGGIFNMVNVRRGGEGLELSGEGKLITIKNAYSYFWSEGTIEVNYPRLDTGVSGEFGEWRLGGQYFYDVKEGVLYQDQQARAIRANKIIKAEFEGNTPSRLPIADGTPLVEARFNQLTQVKSSEAGDLYLSNADAIYQLRAGKLYRVVGKQDGGGASHDDGRPAREAHFEPGAPYALGPGGLLYYASYGKIYQVDAAGIVHWLGGGGIGSGGNPIAGLARGAGIAADAIKGLTVDRDGAIYFSSFRNSAHDQSGARYISQLSDGVITHLVRTTIKPGLGAQAERAMVELDLPYSSDQYYGANSFAVDNTNGILYIGMHHRIYRINKGELSVYVGDGDQVIKAGLAASEVSAFGVPSINDLMVHQGELYFSVGSLAYGDSHAIWKVDGDGIIQSVAGVTSRELGHPGEVDYPEQAVLTNPAGIAISGDGKLYLIDNAYLDATAGSLRVISSLQPPADNEEIRIPSEDGREIYIFNGVGVHQRTLDAVTGVILKRFEYDATGQLLRLVDRDGDITHIHRQGSEIEIVSPEGRRERLILNNDHSQLSQAINAAGEASQFSYNREGMLTELTDPRQNRYQMIYTTEAEGQPGLLKRDINPEGGYLELERMLLSVDEMQIAWKTALGRGDDSTGRRSVAGIELCGWAGKESDPKRL